MLVARQDLRGLFHIHTVASDGRDALETMVRAAKDAGYGYVAITDHSQSAGYAGGLTMERMRAQREEIRALRRRLPEMRIFHGAEADILADGSIDYGDDFLGELDLVVASVHSRFGLNRDEQTARLIRAVRNPRVAILGHPTGRLLLTREGVSADMEAVIDAAAEHGCALEINASPHRMDLDWRLVRHAVERGATLAIDPDAHSTRRARVRPLRPGHGPQRAGPRPEPCSTRATPTRSSRGWSAAAGLRSPNLWTGHRDRIPVPRPRRRESDLRSVLKE